MPYGQGRRLGESIDPRLMQADFSGYANAGMIQGQALANMGKQIGDAVKMYNENKKQVKSTEDLIRAVDTNFAGTPLGDQAREMLQRFTSPDASMRDQLAMRDSIQNVLQVGIAGLENQRANEMMALRRASMAAKGEAAATPISPAQIEAAVKMANAAGFGAPVNSLFEQYKLAQTPEAQQQVAQMIMGYTGEIKPTTFKGQPTAQPYKIAATPAKVPRGDKMVSEWLVTAPDGSEFTVDAKQKQRLNKAIQSGKPFDLAEVLGKPSILSQGAEMVRQLLSQGEYGTETPQPARPTSFQERQEAHRRLIEYERLAAQGDEKAAIEAAVLRNSLNNGLFGNINLVKPEELLGKPSPGEMPGNPFDFE